MTKRFTHHQIYDGISEHEQFYDNHKRMRYDEVCDKLNEQDERIKELKKELQVWKDTAEALQDQLAHKIDEVLIDD